MAQPIWLEALSTIGFGALAGGITNAVAVWMLFHPYERRGVGPLAIQGAIPKNRARLARAIGKTVGQRLLSQDDLAQQLTSPVLRDAFGAGARDGAGQRVNSPRRSILEELRRRSVAELEQAPSRLRSG
jgi:uncharacterized membrane protein YheB (UPF0754 family)